MLSVEKCRQLIPDSENLPDEEITEIRESLYDLARIAFERWRVIIGDSKNPQRVLPNNPKEVI